jgi:hypothetical protein
MNSFIILLLIFNLIIRNKMVINQLILVHQPNNKVKGEKMI